MVITKQVIFMVCRRRRIQLGVLVSFLVIAHLFEQGYCSSCQQNCSPTPEKTFNTHTNS